MWCCFYVDRYSLHINCGGKPITVGKIMYEGDEDQAGAAKFVRLGENWGFSSTGHFWDVTPSLNDYLATNLSLQMDNSQLYTSARISPLSITYYARCLANGKYTVKLHFAEIVFRGNRSSYSLGRRIFDVYVQVFDHIYCSLYVIVEDLIELICCRKNW